MRLITLPAIGTAMFLFVAGSFADENKNKKNPTETFQGEWNVVFIRFAGYEVKGTSEKPMKISFTKDRVVSNPRFNISSFKGFTFGSDGFKTNKSITITMTERDQEGTFRIDPSKTPAQIDLEEKIDKKVRKSEGIYRVTDNGIELCIGMQKRPSKFKANNSAILMLLQRKTKKN